MKTPNFVSGKIFFDETQENPLLSMMDTHYFRKTTIASIFDPRVDQEALFELEQFLMPSEES